MAKTVSKHIERYKDIDLDFIVHPHTNDIVTRTNEQAISGSIINIIKTMKGERVFQPNFGSTIYNSLFEPMSTQTRVNLEAQIETAIRMHEPRAIVKAIEVQADPDMNRYNVSIVYEPKNSGKLAELDFFLERLR